MINKDELTKEELKLILRGLYVLEDGSWFFENKEPVEALIDKLEKYTEPQNTPVCDI
jgi:hypothetical protein